MPRKIFKVRTRLGFIVIAAILAILLIGTIAWYGFKEAHIQIFTFQRENIPQLKNSLNLSELGTALETLSLTIPLAISHEQLSDYYQHLQERMTQIEALLKQLLEIHEQILARDPNNINVQICKEHIISLSESKQALWANLTDLLAITETMIDLENSRQQLFDNVSQHTSRVRMNLRKKIDTSNTELQTYVQHLEIHNDEEFHQKTHLLTGYLDNLRNVMEGLADSEKMYGYLSIAASSQNIADIRNMTDVFNADLPIFMTRINRIGSTEIDDKINEDMKMIAKSGIGKNSIFSIRQRQFEAREKSSALMAETKRNVVVMRNKIDTIVELIDDVNQRGNQATLQKTRDAMNYILVLIPLVALIIAAIAYWLGRSIVKPLTQAVTVADAIASGNLNNEIEVYPQSRDEVNQLLSAFASMQTQLRERIEQDKRIADAALRINSALDSVTTSVFIADNHHQIIYFNKAAETLLKKEESNLRRQFNNFDVSKVIGTPLDSYHRDPARQRQLIVDLVDSHNSKFNMGSSTIDAIVTPVVNTEGKRLGTVAEFRDVTAQMAVEKEINKVVEAASTGDFQQRITLENKTGFFRVFSEGLNQIIDYNQLAVKDTMRMFATLAKGDLTQVITNDYVGAFEQLKNDANFTVEKLTDIMKVIKQMTDSVGKVATEISHSHVILNSRSAEQAKFLQQTGANTEKITATVQKNAENARYAAKLATNAKERAEQGGKVVGQAIVAISKINHSSQRVADIIGVIDDIAFQTNLLALNAAVEAARAGAQGCGFAVVAAEVRHLAGRSAAAAKEIKQLIQDSVSKVTEGTKLADKSGQELEEIVTAVKKVSDIITEIVSASQEQAAGIQQINQTMSQMDKMTQQNALLIEENAIATYALAEQAKNLQGQVAFFNIGTPKD